MANWDRVDAADGAGGPALAELESQLSGLPPLDSLTAQWLQATDPSTIGLTLRFHQAAIEELDGQSLRVPLGTTSSVHLVALQKEGFAALGALLPALFLSDDLSPTAVIDVAFGQTRPSVLVRQQLLGRDSNRDIVRAGGFDDFVMDPPTAPEHDDDWDFIWNRPGVDPRRLFDRATRDLLTAIGPLIGGGQTGWRDYQNWLLQCTTDADGITSLNPRASWRGGRVTIGGQFPFDLPQNLGQSPYTFVVVADENNQAAIAKDVVWSGSAIEFTVPEGAATGCVGFLRAPGPMPSWSATGSAEALLTLAGVLGETSLFGTAAYGAAEAATQLAATIPLTILPAAAPCLPPGRGGVVPNHLYVGPPTIDHFRTQFGTDAVVVEQARLRLEWKVENATQVSIHPITNASTSPDSLSELPNPSVPSTGTWESPPLVRVSPLRDWSGTYELTARNPSGSVSATVHVDVTEPDPLFGLADTHLHLMGHLASGGFAVSGKPHPSNPQIQGRFAEAECLPKCHHPGHGAVLPTFFNDPPSLDERHCLNGGYPDFIGWPRQETASHQSAYLDWFRRAYDGGLRLVVCLAGNSAHLARRTLEIGHQGLAPDDVSAMVRQIQAMKDMVRFVDLQEQAAGRAQGWIEIATDAAKARDIVAAGRMCVVLGVELAHLGTWVDEQALRKAAMFGLGPNASEVDVDAGARRLIEAMVSDMRLLGVTHVFPLHALNNAFGGAGLFVKDYDAANFGATGKSFKVAPAPPGSGISYRLDNATYRVGDGKPEQHISYYGLSKIKLASGAAAVASGVVAASIAGAGASLGIGLAIAALGALISAAVDVFAEPIPPDKVNWSDPVIEGIPNNTGHINAQGATRYMPMLLDALMKRGMIIDIDHLGIRTLDAVLTYVEAWGYPVVSGHTQFREQKPGFAAPTGMAWSAISAPAGTAPFGVTQTQVDVHFGTRDPDRLSTEIDKSVDELKRIKALGGFVSPIIGQGHLRECGCAGVSIANTSPGSSRSFARALQYAVHHFGPRHIGFGTDINGAGPNPSARFGPIGASYISKSKQSLSDAANSLAAGGSPRVRRQAILAQDNGVVYAEPITDIETEHRWEAPPKESDPPFDAQERMIFHAVMLSRSADPSVVPSGADGQLINAIAAGMLASSRSLLPLGSLGHSVGYRLAHPGEPGLPFDPPATDALVSKGRPIVEHLNKMDSLSGQQSLPHGDLAGSRIYQGSALTRTSAGQRKYDINVDGLAHIGLLPDFMQELHNLGTQEIRSLYRSANDYIVMWERCEKVAQSIPL